MALARLAATAPERLLARAEVPAAQALATRGFPPRTIDGFVRPLLAALLADPALGTSSRCADLALHTFATGRLCIPEGAPTRFRNSSRPRCRRARSVRESRSPGSARPR